MKWFKWIVDILSITDDTKSKFALIIDYKKITSDTADKKTRKLEIHIGINIVLVFGVILLIIYIDL